jgi:hypothetical protein
MAKELCFLPRLNVFYFACCVSLDSVALTAILSIKGTLNKRLSDDPNCCVEILRLKSVVSAVKINEGELDRGCFEDVGSVSGCEDPSSTACSVGRNNKYLGISNAQTGVSN